ncbi:hypothetical protein G9F72_021600 [Clostridium estertheticum]|uniref:hypothetical protein n=1 Tax=Clostridium estertheticum TaxID=238834 RepID=UPI0013E97010|nr:hypothetical protein [Clostridium estertheticum]MBZ9688917.1 hypothetical protein [Clostridium estertheticum]
MKQIKKSLSIFMAAIFVMAGVLGNVTAKAATATPILAVVNPTVNYVGISHSPLIVGDTENFTVTSNYTGDVQYRAFQFDGKAWTELTKGYTEAVNAKTPYVLPETAKYTLGQHKLSVWVKKAGTTGVQKNSLGDFDTYYAASLNCVSKNDSNRVYANGKANFETSGLTVKFNGIEGIGGIEGPYLYRMHIYNPTTGVWTNRVSDYSATPSYTFEKAGTYMVVVHANTAKSTTWKNYLAETDKTIKNQGKTYGTYEAWKTIMVTVTDSTTEIFKTTIAPSTTGVGAIGSVTLTADGVKTFATAKKYQIFDGVTPISAIVDLGTSTTVFPAKVAGDKVNVKLLDASSVLVKEIPVALGQSGTITTVPPVKSEVTATVKPSTTGVGSLGTVTSTQANAVSYQILDGVNPISAIVKLGATTTIFPAKVAGDKVTVKLFDAAGTVVGTSEAVVLVAAK